jgi:hypothetical protein
VKTAANGAHGPPAIQDVSEKDDSTIVATINPRMNDGYRWKFVARLVPESPKPLAHKSKEYNAHADEEYGDFVLVFSH